MEASSAPFANSGNRCDWQKAKMLPRLFQDVLLCSVLCGREAAPKALNVHGLMEKKNLVSGSQTLRHLRCFKPLR